MKLETDDFLKDILRWKKFYIYEKKTLQRSEKTLEQYERILESFYNFSIEHEDYMSISSISKQYILNFLIYKDEENGKEKSATSKHSYITVLKSFFKYISENNAEKTNLVENIKGLVIKLPKREPKGINADEVTLLLTTLEDTLKKDFKTEKSKITTFRNILIIKVLLYGGLRASEALGLKFEDIEYLPKHEVYKIKVLGKGNKERYTYIDNYKIKEEITYLINKKREYVAETKPGKIMDRKNLWSMVFSYYRKAGVDKKQGIHILRHTFAQSLVESNVNLSTIQDLLGHANIQTTMIYARTNEKNKIEAIKNNN